MGGHRRGVTAYAIQILARPGAASREAAAVARACEFLDALPEAPPPPLWHDKDRYAPIAVVEAELLAARRRAVNLLTQTRFARGAVVASEA